MTLHIGYFFEALVNWLKTNLSGFFKALASFIEASIGAFEWLLGTPHPFIMIAVLAALALWVCGRQKWGLALFTVCGYSLIYLMELWPQTMQTLALVLASTLMALLIGIPLGVMAGRSASAEKYVRPLLDFMQTMPAFVYLIPAVLFFALGKVPGAVATVIFAMPPSVRLTILGIHQVPTDAMEASEAFGAYPMQQLVKVQLPMALPSILAGVNQTIMLSLSMVVIAAMIGAGGLGEQVLRGITQLRIGMGFEAGVAIVILAMYLDRMTHTIGLRTQKKQTN